MKSSLKPYFWRLLFSILLFLFLLRFVNQKELSQLLKNVSWPYLAGYLALSFLDRLIMAYKWKILLQTKEIPCTWPKLIMIYFKGTFLGNLLPTTIGGDAVRAYELSKNTKTAVDVISSIIMERFLGFLSSALLALLVVPLLFFMASGFPTVLIILLILFFSAGILFLLLLMRGGGPGWIKGLLDRLPWAAKLSQVTSSFLLYRRQPRALVKFFLWSFGEQLLPIFSMYFLILTLGLAVPFYYLLPVIPMAQFFARIPISLSGFGLQEGLFITLFSFFGVSSTAAFSLGLASNLGNIVSSLPGAYFYFRPSGTAEGHREA
jgi:uncharacterized membrane protein YbhN (UPF0104 family)